MKNMKIFTNQILSFSIIILMSLILGIVSAITLSKVAASADKMYENDLIGMSYISSAIESFEEIRINSLKISTGAFIGDIGIINEAKLQVQTAIDDTNVYFNAYAEIENNAEIRSLFPGLISSRDIYLESLSNFVSVCERMLNGDTSEFNQAFNKLANDTVGIREALRNISSMKVKYAEKSNEDANNLKNVSMTVQITLIFVIAIFSIAIALVISISLEKRLRSMFSKIMSSADTIHNSLIQLSESTESLAAGSAKQAAAIEETSAAMNEAASAVAQNTDNTREASKIAGAASDKANVGMTKMSSMVDSMEQIKDSSNTIGKIAKTIDDISFQTRLLALNATIEAARAGGESGRSFSAVADEIGSLAQKSEKEANDATDIIDKNIALTNTGRDMSREVSDSLSEITKETNHLSMILREINASSEEQSIGIKQINAAVTEMERVTQANASVSEENAALANNIKSEVDNLIEAVQVAKTLVR